MTTQPNAFDIAPVSRQIWEQKYRLKKSDGSAIERSIGDTWARVARAAADAERGTKKIKTAWARRFEEAMSDLEFLPAGRIIAGAGANRAVTLFNCFVMGPIQDDLGAIFEQVKQAAQTMQAGGGIGHDFSTLRPRGALVRSIGADASGPVSFMDVWDAMCRTIMSAGARRGAMMATLRCDHPDIEEFIAVKSDAARLRNFNLSVLVTDAFIAAVKASTTWDLVFDGKLYSTVDARGLWHKIMRATYEYAEPGVIFIDRINAMNNLAYCEQIHATNPCGEQPLPAYGACLLGSMNLTRFITEPFSAQATIDLARLEDRVRTAVRFLDNIVDVSNYPLKAQAHEARSKRRIGLGITGLADALIMCGLRYGSAEALTRAAAWMATIQETAYLASADLAGEKGQFPLYDADKFLRRPNVQALSPQTRQLVARQGVRNGCLTSIAPTGTISLLAGNVSSGIEPVFDFCYRRRILQTDGSARDELVEDYAHALYRQTKGAAPPKGGIFVAASDVTPGEHLAMQAAIQRHVDSSISKTINCPADLPFEAFEGLYLKAYDLGLKGCTTFRPNAVTGSVLIAAQANSQERPLAQNVSSPPAPLPVSKAPRKAVTTAPGRADTGAVVYMAKPLERDPVLPGFTYKLIWPGQDNALYVTINDIERGARRCPFEIFINTKNLEHYAWTVALTRMISAVFRRGGDVTFVAEELKAIFDPQGGRWMEGRYVPSLLAAIGNVIERHMQRIGFVGPGGEARRLDTAVNATEATLNQGPDIHVERLPQTTRSATTDEPMTADHGADYADAVGAMPNATAQSALMQVGTGRFCPRCASPSMIRVEGCWSCNNCGYAHCD